MCPRSLKVNRVLFRRLGLLIIILLNSTFKASYKFLGYSLRVLGTLRILVLMLGGRGVRKAVENGEEGVEYSLLTSPSSKLFYDDIVYNWTVVKIL
jgi:hypothetical protein